MALTRSWLIVSMLAAKCAAFGVTSHRAAPRGAQPCASRRRSTAVSMAEESPRPPGVPSFEQFKKMMEEDVAGSDKKLSLGEQVSKGVKGSWVNPAYWNRQFVQASHISNNVPNASRVLELGKDAKNLYYLNSPASCTLVVPPSNVEVKEGPLREAAAKLGVPFVLHTGRALDDVPVSPNAFDAALCFDMLDGAPEQAAAGALTLLLRSLVPDGRLLFLERSSVGVPALARQFGMSVQFDTEGGFDVGIATKRAAGKSGRKRSSAPPKARGATKATIAAMEAKGGFGAAVATSSRGR